MGGTRVYVGGLPYGVREKDLERFFKGYGRIRDILMKNGYGFVEFDDHRDADDAVYELNGKDLLGERVKVQMANDRAGSSNSLSQSHRQTRSRRRSARNYAKEEHVYRNPNRLLSTRRDLIVLVERARGVPRDGRDSGFSRGRFSARDSRDGRRGQTRGSDKYGPPTRTEYRLIVENLSSRVSWQDLKDFMRKAGEVTYADAHKQRRNEGVVEFSSYSDMKAAIDKLDDSDLNGRRIRLVEDRGRGGRSRRSRSKSSSRSRSDSRSRSRSRSRSKSKSRSKSASKSRSRSKSPVYRKSKSKSKSRSRSPAKAKKSPSRSRSRSMERSRSRSVSKDRDSRSRSPSVSDDRNGDDRSASSDRGD